MSLTVPHSSLLCNGRRSWRPLAAWGLLTGFLLKVLPDASYICVWAGRIRYIPVLPVSVELSLIIPFAIIGNAYLPWLAYLPLNPEERWTSPSVSLVAIWSGWEMLSLIAFSYWVSKDTLPLHFFSRGVSHWSTSTFTCFRLFLWFHFMLILFPHFVDILRGDEKFESWDIVFAHAAALVLFFHLICFTYKC